jgi:hypothetical protein
MCKRMQQKVNTGNHLKTFFQPSFLSMHLIMHACLLYLGDPHMLCA